MAKQIITAGTVVGEYEEKYVLDAVRNLGNPDHFKDYVYRFEAEFAKRLGVKHAFAVVNGTAALHLGLLALGVGKGDEVIIPDMTYIACANVVSYTGATPILVDIDPVSWCLNPKAVKRAITPRTKAIMPVWMYGSVPAMDELKSFGIPIIEDSCPAFGAYYKGSHAGTIGEVGAFSFQGAKVLATGEGGMLVTNSDEINERARKLADMGITKRQFWHDERGYMYEMAPILAAVGLGQLQHADEMVQKKRQIYEWYRKRLAYTEFGTNSENESPNYWMSSIVVRTPEERDKIREHLKRNGIDTRPFFYPISMFGLYEKKVGNIELGNSYSYYVGLRGINLPSRVDLEERDIEFVYEKIKECIKNR